MNEIIPNILNEDLLANAEPQYAIAPLLIWAAGAAGAALIGWIIYEIINSTPSKPVVGTSICVLGQKESGKTTFLNWLRYDKFTETYTQTSNTEYEEFKYETESTIYKIASGKDIGGDNSYKSLYETLISKNEICIFVFDVAKFLKDSAYRQETWDRADLIYHFRSDRTKRHTIGTHFNNTDSKDVNEIANKVVKLSENKRFKDMFAFNFTVVDFAKRDSFKDCVKRIFG